MRTLKQKSQDIRLTYKNGNRTFGINKTGNVLMNAKLRYVRLTTIGVEKQYVLHIQSVYLQSELSSMQYPFGLTVFFHKNLF